MLTTRFSIFLFKYASSERGRKLPDVVSSSNSTRNTPLRETPVKQPNIRPLSQLNPNLLPPPVPRIAAKKEVIVISLSQTLGFLEVVTLWYLSRACPELRFQSSKHIKGFFSDSHKKKSQFKVLNFGFTPFIVYFSFHGGSCDRPLL